MLPTIITRMVGWAVAVFYRVERMGPGLVSGPVLVAANHPNSLIDPLLIFYTGGRRTRPLAKAPLFDHIVVGIALRGLGGIPVYRRQDDPHQMHRNTTTFDAAIAALVRGEAVQIYPEGRSHSEPRMSELRTGAARIALMAEVHAGWNLGLRVQPVGLTYERKPFFRGRAVASYGAPIAVSAYREGYEADEKASVRLLTRDIREALLDLTLEADTAEDRELIDLAERIWAREKREVRPRERQTLSARLPRMRLFARAYARLRSEEPERAEHLRAGVRRYHRMVTALGVREGDVPPQYHLGRVTAYAARHVITLSLVLPAAVLGVALWAIPYHLTRVVAQRFRASHDQVATYKLSVGFFVFPLWLIVTGAVAGAWLGFPLAFATTVGSPLLAWAAIAWRARQAVVREDVRVFLRARRLSDAQHRLNALRSDLVSQFDEVASDWLDNDGAA